MLGGRTGRWNRRRVSPQAAVAPTQQTVKGKTIKGTKNATVRNTDTTRGVKQRGGKAAPAPSGDGASSAPRGSGSRAYFNFTGFPFPLGPFFERRTVRTEVSVGRVGRIGVGRSSSQSCRQGPQRGPAAIGHLLLQLGVVV